MTIALKRLARLPVTILVLIAVAASPVSGQDSSTGWIDFDRYTLGNGLTLIVHEDHKAPIVAVNVWYHVGSKNEGPGQSGFAHLFEHLMFNGSEHMNEDYFGVLEPMGATDLNGTTDKDRTNYFQTVPTSALDAVLWMESDRMGFLSGALDQETLDEQRGVVRNEMLQEAGQPYGRAHDVVFENAFPEGHPYARPVKGNPDELDKASLDDAHRFIDGFYGARNAVVVVAGDVDSEDVRRKVEYYFGDVAAGPDVERPESWVPRWSGSRRVKVDEAVPQARLYKVWNVPAWGSPELARLDLVSDLLAGGPSSPLQRRLVWDGQIATEVSAYVFELELGGLFVVEATAAPGVELADLEQAIDDGIAHFSEVGPDEAALRRGQVRYRAEFIRGIERIGGFGGKSDVLAEGEVYAGRPDAYRDRLEWVEETSAAEVVALASAWLGADQLVVEVSPGSAVATAPEAEAWSAPMAVDRSGLPDVGEPPPANFPALQRTRLENGLEIILAERPGAPLVDFRLIVNAGYSADAFAAPGAAAIAMAMLEDGTERRTGLEIAEQIESLGATFRAGSNMDISVATLSALEENLRPSLDLFADLMLHPDFPEDAFAFRKESQLATVDQEKSDPTALAMRLMPGLLYPDGHPYSGSLTGSGTPEGVSTITRQTVSDFHEDWFRPGNATLIVVGATTLADIRSELERTFGDWRPRDTPVRPTVSASGPDGAAFYIVDVPGAEQSTIMAGQLAPPKSEGDEPAVQIANAVLGGDFMSRINTNLREDKGWTYGTQSLFFDQVASRPYVIFAPVQTDRTADAVREIVSEISSFAAERPVTDNELMNAVGARVLTMPGQWATNADLMNALTEMVEYGLPETHFTTFGEQLKSLDVARVTTAARETLRADRLVWMVIGDRAVIEPGLRALALGPIFELSVDGAVGSRLAEEHR